MTVLGALSILFGIIVLYSNFGFSDDETPKQNINRNFLLAAAGFGVGICLITVGISGGDNTSGSLKKLESVKLCSTQTEGFPRVWSSLLYNECNDYCTETEYWELEMTNERTWTTYNEKEIELRTKVTTDPDLLVDLLPKLRGRSQKAFVQEEIVFPAKRLLNRLFWEHPSSYTVSKECREECAKGLLPDSVVNIRLAELALELESKWKGIRVSFTQVEN